MRDSHEFAQLLNNFLATNGRSPTQLAHQLQLSPETIIGWLNGNGRPKNIETVIQIIESLSITDMAEQASLLRAAGFDSSSQITKTSFHGPVHGPVHTGSGDININPLSLAALKAWLNQFFRWSEADEHMRSSWAGMAIWSGRSGPIVSGVTIRRSGKSGNK